MTLAERVRLNRTVLYLRAILDGFPPQLIRQVAEEHPNNVRRLLDWRARESR